MNYDGLKLFAMQHIIATKKYLYPIIYILAATL